MLKMIFGTAAVGSFGLASILSGDIGVGAITSLITLNGMAAGGFVCGGLVYSFESLKGKKEESMQRIANAMFAGIAIGGLAGGIFGYNELVDEDSEHSSLPDKTYAMSYSKAAL